MAAGVPPVAALATNKLQSTIGTGSAFLTFWRAGHVDLRRFAWPAAGAFAGSVLGATAVQYVGRSEEHTSELQSLMRISYAVFCLKKKKNIYIYTLIDYPTPTH